MHRTEITVRMLQATAVIVSLAVIFWSLGFPLFHFVDAANITSVSDTLSDSDPTAVSNHTIVFTTPTGVAAGQQIIITFPSATFDLSSIDAGDIDMATSTEASLQDGAAAGGVWGVATTSTTITITSGTATIGANATVTIEIGTHATTGGTGNGQIVNPGVGSYEINFSVGASDAGATKVVIIDNVDVTASVDTFFTFNIAGVNGGQTVNGTTTTGTTTATAIAFGKLQAGVATTTAQDLTVTTNAKQGYVVTVSQSQNLLSSTGADIDGFIDGAYTNTPTTWSFPSKTLGNENTYGHWGLTSEDATTTETVEFGVGEYVSASTTPRVIMSHDGPSDGVTQGVGVTRIGYTIAITSLQEAGDDYSTTLTYVATPTF